MSHAMRQSKIGKRERPLQSRALRLAAPEHAAGAAGSAATDSVRSGPVRGFEPGPRARALLRGIEIAEQDLKIAGGTFGLDDVMRLLRISRQAIDKKVKADALLAVPGPGNERRYPACQFRSDGVVPGLREVLQALPSRNPWSRLNFLVNPEPRLSGGRPCELLQRGDYAAVIEAAARKAVMGA
jgi:hypothetical protein